MDLSIVATVGFTAAAALGIVVLVVTAKKR
jgi:hypothetical protein